MNRNLPLVLSILGFLNATSDFCSSAIAAVLKSNASDTDREADEKEYNESKYFPKKGKYADWIEANKLSNQGVKLARTGNYRRAIPFFQKAIRRYSYDYTYYENLGAALHKIGNLERAESTTELAAQLAPNRWGPWYNLGLILTKEHEYKRALAALKKAKSLHAPPSRTAGINRLMAALERKLESEVSAPETAAKDPSKFPQPSTDPSQSDNTATAPSVPAMAPKESPEASPTATQSGAAN